MFNDVITPGGGALNLSQKNREKKHDFFKSVQTFSGICWACKDRIGDVVSPRKRFLRTTQTREENRQK